MRRLRWCAPALAAAALLAAGCGGSDNGGGSGSDSSKPIRIGASLPLTGDFSEPGKAAQQGYQVWQKMVNDQGGLLGRKVQVVVRDDASDQNTVVSDYNALISRQKVDMLLGTFSSLLNLPASTVAERNRKLYVEPAGGAPEIFSRGYKHIFFAQQATADHQGDVFAQYILSLPPSERPKTAAYPSLDDPFALPVLQGLREKFEKAGIKTVYTTKYASENTNFDSIANAVKAANPDIAHARRDVRGRRELRARARQGRLQAEVLLPDERAVVRRPVLEGHRRREHRGDVLRGVVGREGADAGQRRVRQAVQPDVRRGRAGRGRGGRVRRRSGHAGRRQGRRGHRRPDEARRLDPLALRATRSSGR